MSISPSSEQSEAIRAIVTWYGEAGRQEFYLAGFAGVGKSTIANIAIEEIKGKYGIKDKEVRTAAYTGKAASVLRRKGVKNAQTIHSLIYTPEADDSGQVHFKLSAESDAAKAELIVLDECSMVDEATAKDLRSFGKKILVMGDPGQLPPVGRAEGSFTNRRPDVFLQEIHRQAADSPILELATLARQGKSLPQRYENSNVKVLPLTKESQELIYLSDTQVICGVNRVRWTYTQRIRARRGHEGQKPEIGERIICCKNNRWIGLFNGGTGTLNDLKCKYKGAQGAYEIDVKMDDRDEVVAGLEIDPYHFDNHFALGQAKRLSIPDKRLEEFDWGYVITCHKAQGSSWGHVTIVDDSGAFKETRNKWLYTAITRAENGLTLLTRQ